MGTIRLTYHTQDVDSYGDRPVTEDGIEIEITPEMIEAGCYVLSLFKQSEDASEFIVQEVFLAMIQRAQASNLLGRTQSQ